MKVLMDGMRAAMMDLLLNTNGNSREKRNEGRVKGAKKESGQGVYADMFPPGKDEYQKQIDKMCMCSV